MKAIALYRHVVRFPRRVRRRRALSRVFGTMAWFGYPVAEARAKKYRMFLRGMRRLRPVMAASGISMREAGELTDQFALQLRGAGSRSGTSTPATS